MTFHVVVAVAAAAVIAAPAAAQQQQGSFEVGGFVGYANYDNSLSLGNPIGSFGARVGGHVLPVLALEVDFAHVSKNGASHTPLHVWVVYNVPPVSRAEIFVGAGYVRNSYGGTYDADDSGIAGMVGVRHRLSDMLAIRLDGHSDFMAKPANKTYSTSFNGNWGIQVGVSALLNRARRTP